jgi:hypothetical protein
MRVLYYITSHGYGHAVRAAAIGNLLSSGVEVVFRTMVPRQFFLEEVTRPFAHEPAAFDCGCVQTDGVTVDIQKTIAQYAAIADGNDGRLSQEVLFCRRQGIDCIASDIVPFAFEVAKTAGLPSVAATNFTWHTIYEGYAMRHPAFRPYIDKIKEQYAMADLLCAMYPANAMTYFKKTLDVGPVGRVGTDARERIVEKFGIRPNRHIALIYAGNFGMNAAAWERLAQFDGWEFFGLYPLPSSPHNYHLLSKQDFRYQDCIASADVMIGKLGYGTCAECFINGLPLIYLPREDFAEFPVLHTALSETGFGHCLTREDFYGLSWGGALDSVAKKARPRPVVSDGARTCARAIEAMA